MDDYYTKKEITDMIANLATKDDIKDLKTFVSNVNTGVSIFKISWHTVATIGGFFSACFAIWLVFKYLLGTWIISLLK